MNQQIAIRNDGSIAVATSMMDGWAYGYLIDANGEQFEWPSPLASLLGQGSWKPIDGFDLSTITPPSELDDAIAKAYKRKYASRSEAARAAARARWGNRAVGYSQKVQTQSLSEEITRTVDVEPFDADAFIAAAAEGPVSLVGVHAADRFVTEFHNDPEGMGGGWLGTGTYASLIDPSGSEGQMIYSSRAGRALLELTMQKPLILVQGKNFRGDQENAINDAIWATAGIKAPPETKDPWSYKADEATRRELKNAGYDGIVLIKQERNPGDSLGSQVVVFDAGSQIKIIDSDLDDTEWMRVRETGQRAPVVKAESVANRFDGDGFDLVELADLFDPSIAKAYKRKYATRAEAARAAANARWGNRSGYSQDIKTSVRETPEQAPKMIDRGKIDPSQTILDEVLTESVDPFDMGAFTAAAAKGSVSLVGVHATTRSMPDLIFEGDPRGGGLLGNGIYASLITDRGAADQKVNYEPRGRQALVRLDFKKALVVEDSIAIKVQEKYGKVIAMSPLAMGVATHLYNEGVSKAEFNKQYKAATDHSDPYATPPETPFIRKQGYDGIVMRSGNGDMAAVFSSEQIKTIDPVLTVQERSLVYETAAKVRGGWVGKAVGDAFDGRDFDLVSIEDLENPSVSKAYKRKYATRTEAARAAANARWGNKGYTQGAVTSKRTPPLETELGVEDGEGSRLKILDNVITESVEPFNVDALVKASEEGPVSLVGVHGTHRATTDLPFAGEPQGTGELGAGVYASLLTSSGIGDQKALYQARGRQALVRVDMKKPLVLTDKEIIQTAKIRAELGFSNRAEQALFQDLRKSGTPDDVVNDVFDQTILQLRSYGNTPVQYLKAKGYDGIVMATISTSGAMVSAFNSSQIKAIDPVLTVEERDLVYETGRQVTKAVGNAFDGRSFELVDIEDLMAEPIAKMSRSEAGRYAANIRWGNRTPAVASIDAVSLSRGQKITVEGEQLGNLTINMVDTGIDGDLRNVRIPGYALFDGANMGLRREQMPQVPARVKPQFLSEMRLKGVGVAAQSVDPRTLKPSQADISASRTGEILKKMREGSFYDSPASRILVSKDGFVIDGHHRWAAASAYAFDISGARLPIIRVDLNAADLIPAAREFGAREGIKTLGFGETLKKAARWIFGS